MHHETADELLQQMCRDLRLLWTAAGGPRLRTLSGRVGRGKSQVGAILNGDVRRLPDWDVIRGLVEGIREHAQAHGRTEQITLRIGIAEVWRPRYAMLEYAFRSAPQARADSARPTPAGVPLPVPRQLPPAVPHVAGRTAELAVLDSLIDRAARHCTTVVISAISGMAGVGKTALAVAWAHRVADQFPDGHLYANLRGFDPDGQALDPSDVARDFLDALGVAAPQIPAGREARSARFRSLLAGRRMLVLLDNVRDADQVRPLLPGVPGSVVVVTSRHQLTDLVATESAEPVRLDPLSHADCRELLASRLGHDRVAAEPDAVDEIIGWCGRLPLALVIVAARASTRPNFSLATLGTQLRDAEHRLDSMDSGHRAASVRTAFSWSYLALSPAVAQVFRLLSLHPPGEVTLPAAASLTGVPVATLRPVLVELTDAHLLTEHSPGRYGSHDLLHTYATELARTQESGTDRRRAVHRLLDHHLHTAHQAARLLDPNRDLLTLAPAQPGTVVEPIADHRTALTWLTRNGNALLAATRLAAPAGFDTHTWQLAWTGDLCFRARGGGGPDRAAVQRAALEAAQRLGDPVALAHAHCGLARACTATATATATASNDNALTHFRRALNLFAGLDQPVTHGYTHIDTSVLLERLGRYPEALDETRQALDLFTRAGHRIGRARALNGIGWQHALLGDFPEALECCRRALVLLEEAGDRIGQAHTWDSIGYAHHHLSQYRRAVACYTRALDLFRDLGDLTNQADVLRHLADTHQAAGAPVAARATRHHATEILADIDRPQRGSGDVPRFRIDIGAPA